MILLGGWKATFLSFSSYYNFTFHSFFDTPTVCQPQRGLPLIFVILLHNCNLRPKKFYTVRKFATKVVLCVKFYKLCKALFSRSNWKVLHLADFFLHKLVVVTNIRQGFPGPFDIMWQASWCYIFNTIRSKRYGRMWISKIFSNIPNFHKVVK